MEKRTINFETRLQQLEAIVNAAEGISDRKSPERKAAARAARRIKLIKLLEHIDPATLDDDEWETLQSYSVEYSPATKIDIQIGDDLIELLETYKDVKDLYKKILKWCDNNDAQISGTTIVAK